MATAAYRAGYYRLWPARDSHRCRDLFRVALAVIRSQALLAVFVVALLAMITAVATRSNAPAVAGLVERLVAPGPLSGAPQSFAAQCTACHTRPEDHTSEPHSPIP